VLNGVSRDLGDDYAYDYGYQYNPNEERGRRRIWRRRPTDPSLLFDPTTALIPDDLEADGDASEGGDAGDGENDLTDDDPASADADLP
jgi:hypothetical protein